MPTVNDHINSLLTTETSKETGRIIHQFGSQCSSFLEYGSRGAVSSTIILGSLISGRGASSWMPRYVGVDLIADESIELIDKFAKSNGVSFQFWKGHSIQYPIHETEGFLWDTFHSGGALLLDLERISPYVHKFIMILGVHTFGEKSEALTKGFDISVVSKELYVDEAGAKMGMKEGISKFLEKNSDWSIVREFGELCVLGRKTPLQKRLFKA